MAKPVLITVDDDPQVLRAIERDLRDKYGSDFRILRADSGETALEALEQLKLRNEPVALLLADQRMPRMNGVEFLEKAIEIFPEAKRALLTAYADTEDAIRAINKAKIDHYLLKPWSPPEDHLYPVLNDLLEVWNASFIPDFDGIRVIGDRWSPKSYQVKDFLARNHIPYRWLDVESDEANRLATYAASSDVPELPLLLFPDGSNLADPTNIEIADKIGLKMRATMPFYDLILVGGGPGGLSRSCLWGIRGVGYCNN